MYRFETLFVLHDVLRPPPTNFFISKLDFRLQLLLDTVKNSVDESTRKQPTRGSKILVQEKNGCHPSMCEHIFVERSHQHKTSHTFRRLAHRFSTLLEWSVRARQGEKPRQPHQSALSTKCMQETEFSNESNKQTRPQQP